MSSCTRLCSSSRVLLPCSPWSVDPFVGGDRQELDEAIGERHLVKEARGGSEAFNRGPVPRSGDVHTVNNTRHDEHFHQVHGASYRHLFDLADWEQGFELIASRHAGKVVLLP